MLPVKKTTVLCLILTSSLLLIMCNGDDGNGALSDCQRCLNDYCDCIDGESDPMAQMSCANTAAECVAGKCSQEEAANVDYDDCSAYDGDGQGGSDNDGNTSDPGGEDGPPPESYDGVDLLIVVDNSGSMRSAQEVFSTSVFSLINALTLPVNLSGQPVENVRVGVVTSDMGLQFGEDREVTSATAPGCDARGDDGALMGIPPSLTTIDVESGVVICIGAEGCPAGFGCSGGVCSSTVSTVNCPNVSGNVAETVDGDGNGALAAGTACLVQQGTGGCNVEQQLSAAVRGLEENGDSFLVDTHLLAVLIVSDEEDCSIADSGLFSTSEWTDMDTLNIACNYPSQNNDHLFTPNRIREQLLSFKGGREADVFFMAIVGVPNGGCQGAGDEIGDCLSQSAMQLQPGSFTTPGGASYTHFNPACTRVVNGTTTVEARPGVRFVETAQLFGARGRIASICDSNRSPSMEQLADTLRNRLPN